MPNPPSSDPRERLRPIVPKLMEAHGKGRLWRRLGASRTLEARPQSYHARDLTALYRPQQLRGHIARALANGVTKDEISEIITHLAFYAGWPSAIPAADIAREVLEEQK